MPLPSGSSDAITDRRAERKTYHYKRPFDLAVLIISHIVLGPFFLILWGFIPLLVWLEDRGSVFYRQRRIGQNGVVFDALKFRTMVEGADRSGPAWTKEDDWRLTKVGRVLRRTALDELPQLISIFKGDMSFVGPRALAETEYLMLAGEVTGFEYRLRARPGLTGLAQVYGNRDDAYEKIQFDISYIEEMSLWLDIKLLFLSVWVTLRLNWEKRGRKF